MQHFIGGPGHFDKARKGIQFGKGDILYFQLRLYSQKATQVSKCNMVLEKVFIQKHISITVDK